MTRLIILFYFFNFFSTPYPPSRSPHLFPSIQPMKKSEMGKRVTLPNPETPPSESLVPRVHGVDYSE